MVSLRRRDGRVLLESRRRSHTTYASLFSTVLLAVCDPLSRRYVLLPHIPVDLHQHERLRDFQHKLAPIGEYEDETSFRVICWVHYRGKMVIIVFSSASVQWSIAAAPSWRSLGLVNPPKHRFKNTRGCFYWTELFFQNGQTEQWKGNMLVLDTRTMDFSAVNILASDHMQVMNLPQQSRCTFAIVVPTEGALEMFTVVYSPNGSFHLYHTTQQNNDSSCQLKVVIPLPRGCRYHTMCATDGFVFLQGFPDQAQSRHLNFRFSLNQHQIKDLFSLEVKTSLLKKVCGPTPISKCLHSYFGFPPSLSKPSL